MLTIIGDIIELDHRPVGFITVPNGTTRDRLVELLESAGEIDIDRVKDLEGEVDELNSKLDSIRDLCG